MTHTNSITTTPAPPNYIGSESSASDAERLARYMASRARLMAERTAPAPDGHNDNSPPHGHENGPSEALPYYDQETALRLLAKANTSGASDGRIPDLTTARARFFSDLGVSSTSDRANEESGPPNSLSDEETRKPEKRATLFSSSNIEEERRKKENRVARNGSSGLPPHSQTEEREWGGPEPSAKQRAAFAEDGKAQQAKFDAADVVQAKALPQWRHITWARFQLFPELSASGDLRWHMKIHYTDGIKASKAVMRDLYVNFGTRPKRFDWNFKFFTVGRDQREIYADAQKFVLDENRAARKRGQPISLLGHIELPRRGPRTCYRVPGQFVILSWHPDAVHEWLPKITVLQSDEIHSLDFVATTPTETPNAPTHVGYVNQPFTPKANR
jgi:hypothetical protein